MKTYLVTTGLIFAALTVAHVLRAMEEHHLVRDPFFVATTLIALAFAAWALRLYLNANKGARPPA